MLNICSFTICVQCLAVTWWGRGIQWPVTLSHCYGVAHSVTEEKEGGQRNSGNLERGVWRQRENTEQEFEKTKGERVLGRRLQKEWKMSPSVKASTGPGNTNLITRRCTRRAGEQLNWSVLLQRPEVESNQILYKFPLSQWNLKQF